MITVGVRELKTNLSRYLAKVQEGEEVVVTERGREVALFLPISAERRALKALAGAGKARLGAGKPQGASGITCEGKTMAETVVEERE
jgi:prevent-host-death family protein